MRSLQSLLPLSLSPHRRLNGPLNLSPVESDAHSHFQQCAPCLSTGAVIQLARVDHRPECPSTPIQEIVALTLLSASNGGQDSAYSGFTVAIAVIRNAGEWTRFWLR